MSVSLPDAVVEERGPVLRRILRGLPDEVLQALVRGLERDGHSLMAGRLFRGNHGGCAVGVTLRELDPETYAVEGPAFWLRHAWRRRLRWYRGLSAANPRLQHLEWTFDRAVTATYGGWRRRLRREAAVAVGRWIRFEGQAELDWRQLAAAPVLAEASAA